jgi:hypothetical protein
MKNDLAFALVLVAAGVAVTAACSSSSKDKSPDGGAGSAGAGAGGGPAGGSAGLSGASGTGGATSDGGGARGGASGRGGSGGGPGDGGCSMDLEMCQANGDCCGFSAGENVCVDTGDPQLGTACLIVCSANSECASNCCAALEGGSARVCGPASLCGGGDGGVCAEDLEPCETNADCCGFATGDNFCVDTGAPPNGIGVACLIACTAGTQCMSGCCAPLEGGMGSVCAPAAQCQ